MVRLKIKPAKASGGVEGARPGGPHSPRGCTKFLPRRGEVDISFYSVSERDGGGPPFSSYKNLVVEFDNGGCGRLRKYITYAVTGEAFPVLSKAVAFSASAPLPTDLTRLVLKNPTQEEMQDWGRDRGYM